MHAVAIEIDGPFVCDFLIFICYQVITSFKRYFCVVI